MPKIRGQVSIGKLLRKHREDLGYPLIVVIGFLKDDHRIVFSESSLAKVERGEFFMKVNLLAALCLIYEIEPSEIIYK